MTARISLCLLCFFVATPAFAQAPAAPANDDMVQIPAGEFWMGRTFNWLLDELGMHLRPRLDDQPAHLVYIDSFWMDKYEVTSEKYARFAETTNRRKPFHWISGKIPSGMEKFPVYNVTWDDAFAYCRSVAKRLPTEAEWERAARGGVEKTMYPWGNELEQQDSAASAKRARYAYPDGAVPVGSYPPNGFGLYDMIGNVWEWVNDWYDQYYYSITPDKNPPGPEGGLYRVIRGGGWSDYDERILALYYRNFTNSNLPSNTVGFRCAKSQ
jgi:sulfatase modifying factor 1